MLIPGEYCGTITHVGQADDGQAEIYITEADGEGFVDRVDVRLAKGRNILREKMKALGIQVGPADQIMESFSVWMEHSVPIPVSFRIDHTVRPDGRICDYFFYHAVKNGNRKEPSGDRPDSSPDRDSQRTGAGEDYEDADLRALAFLNRC